MAGVRARPATFSFLSGGASNNALFLDLSIGYAGLTGLPDRLVLKAGRNVQGTARREAQFFAHVDPSAVPGVIRCYGRQWLADQDFGLLLLENAGEGLSYQGPDESHLHLYADALRVLANLHAWRWNDAALGSGDFVTDWDEAFIAFALDQAASALTALGDSNPVRADCADALDGLGPRLLARVGARPLCVTHGDAALWNFVMDASGERPVRLLDFQLWGVHPPAWDVAYMLYALWPTALRRAHVPGLLDVYLAQLETHGIDYGRDLERDLGLMVPGMIELTLANLALGLWPEERVRERLEWLADACEDV